MILPEILKIQIVDKDKVPINKENILCHLNIFINSNSRLTYSFIPTDMLGLISITKNDIITNTELRHGKLFNSENQTTKFEFLIIDLETLNFVVKGIKAFINRSDQEIKSELTLILNNEDQVEIELARIHKKQIEERKLLNLLLKCENKMVIMKKLKFKITGEWKEEKEYKYEL